MNIYCIIFMCTFGSNSTDTEMPRNNSLLESAPNGALTKEGEDVASMILPQKGIPVPQIGDIVMELPDMPGASKSAQSGPLTSPPTVATPSDSRDDEVSSISTGPGPSPSLSEILLPPAPFRKGQVTGQFS